MTIRKLFCKVFFFLALKPIGGYCSWHNSTHFLLFFPYFVPMKKTLMVVVGATASGKTALAIRIAQLFATEIISADGRQFFAEMNIGTARPSADELAQVPHHFIASRSIHDPLYSVGSFEREALAFLEKLFATHDVAVLVGGSGLYVKALCEGMDEMPEISLELRENLMQQFHSQGLEPLLAQLQTLDPDYYNLVDKANHQRVIRALEMCITTQQPYSSFRKKQTAERDFRVIKVALDWPREQLYERINKRVEAMVADGLEQEAAALLPYKHLNALQTVGYKEWFEHWEGQYSRAETIERIKQNTRRYAKKQLTWFGRDESVHWITPLQAEQQLPELLELWLKESE